jgi:ribosomal protein S30
MILYIRQKKSKIIPKKKFNEDPTPKNRLKMPKFKKRLCGVVIALNNR